MSGVGAYAHAHVGALCAAGILFGDWRDRRAGRPIDRGYFPALPGDPDY